MDAKCKILRLVNNDLSSKIYGLKPSKLYNIILQRYYAKNLNCKELRFIDDCIEDLNDVCEPFVIDKTCTPFYLHKHPLPYPEKTDFYTKGDIPKYTAWYYITILDSTNDVVDFDNPSTFLRTNVDGVQNFITTVTGSMNLVSIYQPLFSPESFGSQTVESLTKRYNFITRVLDVEDDVFSEFEINRKDKFCTTPLNFKVDDILTLLTSVHNIGNYAGVFCNVFPISNTKKLITISNLEVLYANLNGELFENYIFNYNALEFSWVVLPDNDVYPFLFMEEGLKFSKKRNPIICKNPSFLGQAKIYCTITDNLNNIRLFLGTEQTNEVDIFYYV